MNTTSVIGNLGRDPQLNAAGNMASFSIAVKRQYKDQQSGEYKSDWFNCKAFGKTAELIGKSFQKGSQIAFTGHLQNNNYEKDGQMIYRDEIIVDSITFIGQKTDVSERYDNGQANSQYSNSNQGSGQNGAYNSNQNQNTYNDFNNTPDPFGSANGDQIDIEDDDLPF